MLKLFIKFSYGGWIAAAISFFTTPIITLLILPEEFGKASMFTLAMNFLMQIVLLGVDQGFMRFFYVEKEPDRNKLAWLCFWISIGSTLFLGLLLMPFWRHISDFIVGEASLKVVLLLAVCVILSVMERFTTTVVRMQQKGNVFSIVKIINSAISALVIIFYAKYISPDFYAIIYSFCLSLVITTIIAYGYERKFWKYSMYKLDSEHKELILNILKYSLPLVPIFIIAWFFEGMDKVALSTFCDFKEVGLYASAGKIIAVLTIIQTCFGNFWTPVALETYEKDNQNFIFFENAFKYIATIMLILSMGLIMIKDIVILLFASSYREAVSIMPFLVFMPLMYILSETTGYGIGFKKKTYLGSVALIVAALVNLVGNYLLTPTYGARGTALATGIAFTVYFLVRTFVSIRLFPARYNLKFFILPFIALCVMAWGNTFYKIFWWQNLGCLLLTIFFLRKNLLEIFKILEKKIVAQKSKFRMCK